MILGSVNDKIQVVLGAAVTANQLQCVLMYSNSSVPATPRGRTINLTNNTTDVTLLTGEQGTTNLICSSLIIYNADTVAAQVTIKYDDGSTEKILFKKTINVGAFIRYSENTGFEVFGGQPNKELLAQSNPAATTSTDLYTVPAGKYTILDALKVANISISSKSFRVSISVGGGAVVNKDYFYYGSTIAGNGVISDTDFHNLKLNAGDVVRIYASSNDLSFVLFGTEHYLI